MKYDVPPPVTDHITAILIHVPDVPKALQWYASAFPLAKRLTIEEPAFECLRVGTIQLEIVPADNKVSAGPAGTIVYWHVPDMQSALAHFAELGAGIYRGPMKIENGEWMCQVRDPWNNCIGLRGTYVNEDEPAL